MHRRLIFATGNPHKIAEVRQIAGPQFDLLSPAEAGLGSPELPETSDTLQGNAIEKAAALYQLSASDCFSEDTGLEVAALGGAPGVYTARYAGPECTPEDNIRKLLDELSGHTNRKAQFRTVIALIIGGETVTFEGIVKGEIANAASGTGGFGYDPVFIPEGHTHTFAELPATIKNTLSHRARAIRKMLSFLETFQT